MGWSGGTEIFDCVLNKMDSISQDYEIQHSALIILAEELVKVLEDSVIKKLQSMEVKCG